MEGLQDPYKPISRILGSWVAAKAKGDMELAEGGEKNGEEKLEKGCMRGKGFSPHTCTAISILPTHLPRSQVVHRVVPRTLQWSSAHMSPQPRAKPQVSPRVPSVWSWRWQSRTSRCPLVSQPWSLLQGSVPQCWAESLSVVKLSAAEQFHRESVSVPEPKQDMILITTKNENASLSITKGSGMGCMAKRMHSRGIWGTELQHPLATLQADAGKSSCTWHNTRMGHKAIPKSQTGTLDDAWVSSSLLWKRMKPARQGALPWVGQPGWMWGKKKVGSGH